MNLPYTNLMDYFIKQKSPGSFWVSFVSRTCSWRWVRYASRVAGSAAAPSALDSSCRQEQDTNNKSSRRVLKPLTKSGFTRNNWKKNGYISQWFNSRTYTKLQWNLLPFCYVFILIFLMRHDPWFDPGISELPPRGWNEAFCHAPPRYLSLGHSEETPFFSSCLRWWKSSLVAFKSFF